MSRSIYVLEQKKRKIGIPLQTPVFLYKSGHYFCNVHVLTECHLQRQESTIISVIKRGETTWLHPYGQVKISLKDIEDSCFFEVNTKYISSSELKISEFSRVRSTSENFDVFNSRDEIYLVFAEKRQIFFLFYTIHGHFPIHKAGGENSKTKNF